MKDFQTKTGEKQNALIYCRVSGKKQTKDGSGLSSQEHRCRQYCAAKGYNVVAVFPDDVSGGGDFMNRPAMVALLRYMDDHPDEKFFVVFDDLKRYSRDVEFHHKLRRHMEARNATRECLNFNFEDSPEGKLKETITVAAGEYERESNARQNWQKSIARIEQGYCVQSVPPVGYRYEKAPRGGKVLLKDEPAASILKLALEGFETGLFATQTEVRRFLEAHPEFPKKGKNGKLAKQSVAKLLRRHLYAGLIDGRPWGLSICKGKHEAIVSVATFERIQRKLDQGVYTPARKDVAEDFPLRGAVCCSECSTPLTAGWSKGKRKKYPYYFCRSKGCSQYGKTIARAKIEGAFEEMLAKLQPKRDLVVIAATMFRDFWNTQLDQTKTTAQSLRREAQAAELEIEKLIKAAMGATNPRLVSAYETQIEKLEHRKLVLQEKERELGSPPGKFEDLFEHSIRFLSKPWKLWKTGRFDLQRLVLKLTFSEHLHYCRENGFRTPQTSVPFSFLGDFMLKEKMVPHG